MLGNWHFFYLIYSIKISPAISIKTAMDKTFIIQQQEMMMFLKKQLPGKSLRGYQRHLYFFCKQFATTIENILWHQYLFLHTVVIALKCESLLCTNLIISTCIICGVLHQFSLLSCGAKVLVLINPYKS